MLKVVCNRVPICVLELFTACIDADINGACAMRLAFVVGGVDSKPENASYSALGTAAADEVAFEEDGSIWANGSNGVCRTGFGVDEGEEDI